MTQVFHLTNIQISAMLRSLPNYEFNLSNKIFQSRLIALYLFQQNLSN